MKKEIKKLRKLLSDKAHYYKSKNHLIYDTIRSQRANLRSASTD